MYVTYDPPSAVSARKSERDTTPVHAAAASASAERLAVSRLLEHSTGVESQSSTLRRLALSLIRVVENATGEGWRCVRDQLERLHVVTLGTAEGGSSSTR